jgi:AcrR family transcriptional regulator
MTSGEQVRRRDGYGATSPIVGERGAQTRKRIADLLLRLLASQSFHDVSVDAIAKAAGISRPTLYQYFESKEQIFLELLDECGRAISRLAKRLGPLGPTAIGFDNLHWWLGEWADLYDSYRTVHLQWAGMDSPAHPLRPVIGEFMTRYQSRVAQRLERSMVEGLDPEDAATILVNTVHRYHYFRVLGFAPPDSSSTRVDALAICMQLMLFPDTPGGVIRAVTDSDPSTGLESSEYPLFAGGWVAAGREDPPARFGPRGQLTRRRILDIGATAFRESGFHETRIDDVLSQLDLTRGAFYKYFPTKDDLLYELAEECADGFGALFSTFSPAVDVRGGHDLVLWMREFVGLHQRYRGVMRAWFHGAWQDPHLTATAQRLTGVIAGSAMQPVAAVDRLYPVSLPAVVSVLFAMLEQLPEILAVPARGGDTASIMALAIRRAILSPGSQAPATP